MTMIYHDSFDYYYFPESGFDYYWGTGGRRGGGAHNNIGTNNLSWTKPSSSDNASAANPYRYFGAAFQGGYEGTWSDSGIILWTWKRNTGHVISVVLGVSGALEVWRHLGGALGTPTLLGTVAAGELSSPATYDYVETGVKFSSGGDGWVEIRINNVTKLLVTGINTMSGTSYPFGFIYGRPDLPSPVGAYCRIRYDDYWYLNGLGAFNNTFLGDRAVSVLVPVGDGFYTQWFSSEATRWEATDELPRDDAATNIFSPAGAGNSTTTLVMSNITGVAPTEIIPSVIYRISTRQGNVQSPATQFTARSRHEGLAVDVDHPAWVFDPHTQYIDFSWGPFDYDYFNYPPESPGQWTVENVNALQIGPRVISSGNQLFSTGVYLEVMGLPTPALSAFQFGTVV